MHNVGILGASIPKTYEIWRMGYLEINGFGGGEIGRLEGVGHQDIGTSGNGAIKILVD